MNKFFAFVLVLISQVTFAAFPILSNSTIISNEETGTIFNIGGFSLGLLLGVYGVIIAYLIKEKNVIKSSWLGLGVRAVIALALVLILIYYTGGPILY